MSPESTAPSGQALPAGTRLEEFEVERVLGTGGFGITYLSRDVKLGRQVVIKENLPAQFAFRDMSSLAVSPRHTSGGDSDNFAWSLENFSREASMLASLDHPGIVPVMRSFEAFGTSYFVMPYMEGLPLDELMKNRRERGEEISDDELRGLLEHVLDALGYLHARGIYHRDIKPGNILVTKEGVPILIDFGSARQRLSERSMTVVESAGYTPFEQLQSRGNVGPWSDLYSLGATVFKVITGEAPPKANDRMLGDPFTPLRQKAELRGRYSVGFLSSVDRALSVRVENRWQSGAEWLKAVEGEAVGEAPRKVEQGAGQKPSERESAAEEKSFVEDPGGAAGVAVGAVSPGPKGKGKGMLIAVGVAALLAMVGVGVVLTGNDGEGEERVRLAQEEKEAAQKKAEEAEGARKKAEAALAAQKKAGAAEAARMKAEEELAAQKKATAAEAARMKAEEELAAQKKATAAEAARMKAEEELAAQKKATAAEAARMKAEEERKRREAVIRKALELVVRGEKFTPDFFVQVDREVLSSAAEEGDPRAQYVWGRLHDSYVGLLDDEVEAVKWYRKAAAQDYAIAQANLGFMYQYGHGVAKDEAEAVKWYRKAAEQGDARAQTNLGVRYEFGLGVARDDEEAVKWYRKAAEQGDARAQTNLGVRYANGLLGVARDGAEAVKWLRKAAEQDYADAQNNLGWMYGEGRGVAKDEKEAVKWYRKAAEQDYADAQNNLGWMYGEGRGVAKDEKEAMKWYRKAAEQDHATAQYNLGAAYEDGRGVAKNEAEAVKWYRKAAVERPPPEELDRQ